MRTLHQSRFFISYQSDRGRCFYIDFGHKEVKLSFCQMLAFREKLKSIDLDTHFNGANKHGLEILMLCNRDHIFVFNTLEIIDLKDLIKGTFATLELNSILTTPV